MELAYLVISVVCACKLAERYDGEWYHYMAWGFAWPFYPLISAYLKGRKR